MLCFGTEAARERAGLVVVPRSGGLSKRAMATSFKVGDRVRARPLSSVPAGTLGRVTQTLASAQDLCFVLFDGYIHWRLMRTSELDLVTDDEADEDARQAIHRRPRS